MKPTNPMAQLQAWKETHGKKAQAQQPAQSKPANNSRKEKKPTQQAAQAPRQQTTKPTVSNVAKVYSGTSETVSAKTKRKLEYYHTQKVQIKRDYWLNRQAARRCFTDFPEFYHFKQQYAKECEELIQRLEQGRNLLHYLTQATSAESLKITAENKQQAKRAKQALQFLIMELSRNAATVHAIENGSDNPEADPDPNLYNAQKTEADTGETTETEAE